VTDALPVARAADLDEPDLERRWLVDQLWARAGVGILGGPPKCCKSWLGLEIVVSVSSGSPCLGAFDVAEAGGVLVYMAEDSLCVVKARLSSICRHRGLDLAGLPIDVITAPVIRLDLERDQDRLAETVRTLRPRLLLLDPFVRLHRIDENNAGDVSALLAYLRALQREHDLAIVVTHHARKNGPTGAQAGQGLRGSGDLHAWGDSNLYLRRSRDALVLTVEHRAAAAPAPISIALVGDDDHAHLEIIDGVDDDGCADLDAAVLAALTKAPLSRTALRAAIRVRNERLGHALDQLARAGRVVRDGDRWARGDQAVPVPPLAQERERNGDRAAP
jgi:AAA domain